MESWLVILMFVMGFLIIIGKHLLVIVLALVKHFILVIFLFFLIGIVIIVLITVSKKRNSASIKFIKDTHIVI